MVAWVGAVLVAVVASQEAREPAVAAVPPGVTLLHAQLSSLADERRDVRTRDGLIAVGAGAITLGIGITFAEGTRGPPAAYAVSAVLGGGLIGLGLLNLLVPTREEDLAYRYQLAVARTSGDQGLDVARFEAEWKALIDEDTADRGFLAASYVVAGLAGIAGSVYLGIESSGAHSPAIYVSTAALAVAGISGAIYGMYLWKFYESPAEREWRAYQRSRGALELAPSAGSLPHDLSLAVDVQADHSSFVVSGRF